MRLHQRVRRLSRYGQTDPVDVITVRNSDTEESRIWDLLDEKLARINLAFQSTMDDPEDIRQLVIGMASPGIFTKLFAGADSTLGDQTLDAWFDTETATFGGEDAVDTVRSLVGHVARFDFGAVAAQIPQVDLPDLVPFFKAVLAVRGRRPEQAEDIRLRFRPPDEWKDDFAIAVVDRYDLLFAREPQPSVAEDIAGVGLRVVDRAVSDALGLTATFAAIRGMDAPTFVFAVRDITGSDSSVRAVLVAAQSNEDGAWDLIRDWELIQRLNPLADRPRSLAITDVHPAHVVVDMMADARTHVVSQLDALELPFELPVVETIACLVPAATATPESSQID